MWVIDGKNLTPLFFICMIPNQPN